MTPVFTRAFAYFLRCPYHHTWYTRDNGRRRAVENEMLAQTRDINNGPSALLTLISHSIRGRFDSRPQFCMAATPDSDGRMELVFALESREDGRRTLTITIPSLEDLRAADGCVTDICVVSSDGDDGYVARVTMEEPDTPNAIKNGTARRMI